MLRYQTDMPISGLKTAELLAVSCLRLWAKAYADPFGAPPNWLAGFRAAGLDKVASSAFDAFMRIIAIASTRSLDVRSLSGRHLGQDEALLLQFFAALQKGEHDLAARVLAHWLPPAAMRMAFVPACAFAEALLGAGLQFSSAAENSNAMTIALHHFVADRGAHLLH